MATPTDDQSRVDGEWKERGTGSTAPAGRGKSIVGQIVAFSGGKDSTAMALRLAELGEDFVMIFTPAGNELPELFDHVHRIAETVGKPLIQPENRPLAFWIDHYQALPSFRMRWCTRQIKIQPCIDWLTRHPGSTLSIGLRADEDERSGLYGDYATYRYPLREWDWGEPEVWGYLAKCGISIPRRTNCAVCYGQRLYEWYYLWRDSPEEYARGEAWEAQTGHTFRSPQRDNWPAALKDLRACFERGERPQRASDQIDLFGESECRVCRL